MAESRVLILALRGRDAQVIEQILAKQDHGCVVCDGVPMLAAELAAGASIAIVTEESLADTDRRMLVEWLEAQPAWSDFPFIVMATKRSGARPREAARILEQLGNVVVLERPVHGDTLVSAVASAFRGRKRQYEARRRLEDLKRAEEDLRALNGSLESRILERTEALSNANNQLMQEVAERERVQAALVQSQKMEAVGQLTGGIAHDFNNLLTVIYGNLELIQGRSTDERTQRLSEYARQAADRAAKLTQQLLAFSRTQSLTLKPVDVNGLVDGMKDLLARTIGSQIRIETRLGDPRAWAMADANQLELAILNLAINARDAMPEGGALTIATDVRRPQDAEGESVVISVTDTGQGIPEALLEKVFDPFFTTKAVGKGTGLGLSQVYGIARQSGGTVRIHSVEGEGSTVEIWLPVTAETAQSDAPEARLDMARGAQKDRILVVDDDDGVRRFIVECLETLGYEVDQAAGGREALARLDDARPALLIVDYAMPGLTGVDVIHKVRERFPGQRIILSTGFADMAAVEAVMEPENVLRKPFRIAELAAAVNASLETAAA
ncbi:MAG TPA: ATP-binding protein [Brevundimonas sp.]|uniref:ATP-binding protein n=1 Tax=Brevundimonas sp. TaxID=1871086 RepID=UPI002ED83CC1